MNVGASTLYSIVAGRVQAVDELRDAGVVVAANAAPHFFLDCITHRAIEIPY